MTAILNFSGMMFKQGLELVRSLEAPERHIG